MRLARRYGRFLAGLVPTLMATLTFSIKPPRADAGEDGGAAGGEGHPNIIFILADDLGYGDLGSYGQEKIKTPVLDRLAEEGMRFTQFYTASPLCAPARCALLTGLHSGHCYIRHNGRYNLRAQDSTIAEVLKEADYVTGMVGKWGLGESGSEGIPAKQGFDYFYGFLEHDHARNYYSSYVMENGKRIPLNNVVPDEGPYGAGVATERYEYSQDLITQKALEFVASHGDTSFFLYLAYSIPHMNLEAFRQGLQAWEVPDYGAYQDEDWPEAYKGYAAQITRMDSYVGQVLAVIERLAIAEKTIIIFSSDNGPTEVSQIDPEFFNSAGPLRGNKRSLYEGGIRVPLIAWWPGHVSARSVSDHVSYFPDILPTLADLAGRAPPPDIDGISLRPTLIGAPSLQTTHAHLYWELTVDKGLVALRRDDWKLLLPAVASPLGASDRYLFNLRSDIGETTNLANHYPEAVREMLSIMEQAHTRPEISAFELLPGLRPPRSGGPRSKWRGRD